MASGYEAVAENTWYYQMLVFFSVSLWHDLRTQINTVRCVSYTAVATIRIKLSECKVFDKKKGKKKKEQFVILLLTGFLRLCTPFYWRYICISIQRVIH